MNDEMENKQLNLGKHYTLLSGSLIKSYMC